MFLASSSPYRLKLLRDAGYDVEAVPSGAVEPPYELFRDVDVWVVHLAELKARTVAERGIHSLIFAADTVGCRGDQVFGKPTGRNDARRMLEAISGTVHQVVTGWCLLRTSDNLLRSGVERTTVTMRPWTRDELDAYLDGGEWIGKCGAYGLQWPNDPFVTKLEGSAANVIGVPLERLREVLEEERENLKYEI